jgi:hypothetical protein
MHDRELEELLKELDGMTAPELARWIKSEREKMITGKDLAIRPNNCAVNGWCPVCGGRTDPMCGFELFIRGTFTPVCHRCGDRLNPKLMLWLKKFVTCFNNFYRSHGAARERKKIDAMEKECPFYEGHAA